jgi:hypothetical protein
MSRKETQDDEYDAAETARRRDAIIKRMIATPPQPHKPRAKTRKKPALAKRATARKRAPSA